MAVSGFESILTNFFVFLGDVVSLITYIPNYVISYHKIQRSKKVRSLSYPQTAPNELVFDHVDIARNIKTPSNPYYKDAKTVYEQWKIAAERLVRKKEKEISLRERETTLCYCKGIADSLPYNKCK